MSESQIADADDDSTELEYDADEGAVNDAWEGEFIGASWGYRKTTNDIAVITEVSDTGKTVKARLVALERVDSHKVHDEVQATAEPYGDEFRLHARGDGDEPYFRGSYPYIDGDEDEGTRMGTFTPHDRENTVLETRRGY